MATAEELIAIARNRLKQIRTEGAIGDDLLRLGDAAEKLGLIKPGSVDKAIPAVVKAFGHANRVDRALRILTGEE